MGLDRRRPRELGSRRASDLRRWIGRDLKILRVASGQTQRAIGTRSGVSQAYASEIERGTGKASLETLATVAEAVGGRLVLRVIPGDGVSLRDSGQLAIVQAIIAECHPRWAHTIEMPIGTPPDLRAADLVSRLPEEVDMIEVERAWIDHQAQYRPLQLKREALAERLGRPVNLIVALVDSERTRRALSGLDHILDQTLPVPSRRIWASLRSGTLIGGDGILWIRPAELQLKRRKAAQPRPAQ
jgi:transcriptional regulator with XRE-family HTH domain